MSIFDLEKRQAAVQFVLEKRAIKKAPVMRVGVALDVSGSARHLYEQGIMQKTIDRLVPVAMRFDDNGEMDVWTFDNRHKQMPSVTKMDYEGYIKREILCQSNRQNLWGATDYEGPLAAMRDFYFPSQTGAVKKAGSLLGSLFGRKAEAAPAPAASGTLLPAMGLLITDGANNDRDETERFLHEAKSLPVYWQMVGVGNPREFGFIEQMADDLPNVGFVHLASLDISDEQLYDQLLSEELCGWMVGK